MINPGNAAAVGQLRKITPAWKFIAPFLLQQISIGKRPVMAGSDDGLINVSKDGGQHWDNVTPKEAGQWMMWNCVETDPLVKGKAYFVGTKYKSDDFGPYNF